MAAKSLSTALADRVYKDFSARLAEKDFIRLPPRVSLARQYKTTYPTMRKALDRLIGQGRVMKKSAHVLYLVRDGAYASVDEIPDHTGSVDQLYRTIRESILSGRYHTGLHLPKIEYFTLTYSVSPNTVLDAMLRLQEDEMLYKQGRKWIVGRKPVRPPRLADRFESSYRSDRRTLCIVSRNYNRYYYLRDLDISRAFLDSFLKEMEFNDCHSVVCYLEPVSEHLNQITGVEAIEKYIDSMGSRYIGTLLVGSEPSYDPDLLNRLNRTGKPVAWYDPNRQSQADCFERIRAGRNIVTSYADEKEAVRLVLRYLHAQGHRKVGLPVHSSLRNRHPGKIWVNRRISLIKQCARSLEPGMEIVICPHSEPFFKLKDYSDYIDNPIYLEFRLDNQNIIEYRNALWQKTPSMQTLLQQEKVTALIGLNDIMGREYLVWCSWMGIEVPKDLSIVSFDNRPGVEGVGLTCIDFGYDYAGYRTAHWFLEKALHHTAGQRREHHISTRPRLIHRISAGPPPDAAGKPSSRTLRS